MGPFLMLSGGAAFSHAERGWSRPHFSKFFTIFGQKSPLYLLGSYSKGSSCFSEIIFYRIIFF